MERLLLMTKYSSIIALLLLLTGCSMVNDGSDDPKDYVAVGDRLPAFTVPVVYSDGTTGTFTSTALTGPTVVVFFHTSCSDCQRELPRLDAYYRQHQHDDGFQMVAISREENAESVATFWADQHLAIPYSAQPDRRIYQLFATVTIPRIYFCNSQGIVTRIFVERIDEAL